MELEAFIVYSKDKEYGDEFAESYLTGSLEFILEQIKKDEDVISLDRFTIRDDMYRKINIYGVPLILIAVRDGILWKFDVPAFQKVVLAYSRLKNRTFKDFLKQPLNHNGKYHLFSITHNDDEHIRLIVKY